MVALEIQKSLKLKRGRLALTEDFKMVRIEDLGERRNLLEVVYRDGEILREVGFDEVREKIS